MDIPIFSVNDTVLILGSLQCFLMGIILLCIRTLAPTKRLLLSLFLCSLGADFLDTLMYWALPFKSRVLADQVYVFYLLKPVALLAAPALYLYIKSVLYTDFAMTKYRLVHMVPAALVALLLPLYLLLRSTEFFVLAKYDYDLLFYDPPFQGYLLLKNITYLSYGFASYRLMLGYTKRLKQGFLVNSRIDPVWLRLLVIGFLVVWLLYAASYLSHLLFEWRAMASWAGLVGNYLNLLFVTSLVMYSLIQSRAFINVRERHEDTGLDRRSDKEEQELATRMHTLMHREKLYLDPDLSLERLAGKLGVSSKLVSSVLNHRLRRNFFEYVNEFRVKRALSLIAGEASSKPMAQVMRASGFNSKSTFNRCFKRATGKTPSDYRQTLKRTG